MPTPKKTHGGSRPGAGRPPTPPTFSDTPANGDPLKFLQTVMGDTKADMRVRAEAAKALMPYMHRKVSELGVKAERVAAGAKAAAGRYAPGAAPLRAVK